MVIVVKEVVPRWFTFEDGEALRAKIEPLLVNGYDVEVSFEGVDAVSSSFINGAFVKLLDGVGYGNITKRLRIVRSTSQINSLIRDRVRSEATKRHLH